MDTKAPQISCRRCGTCCRKGGPALHLEDRYLVWEGKIPLKDLFTIRKGEPAYDNIAETLAPAPSDILKIKPVAADGTACVYFQHDQKGCAIYAHRPWECRTLACWKPQPLIDQYQLKRLTRRHLLSTIEGLWDLVCDHQKKCDYREIARLAAGLHKKKNDLKAKNRLMELIRYDQFLRESIVERSTLTPEMLEFLMGRALRVTIRMFQLKLVRIETETTILPFV